jgi:hypothetical protein
MRWRAYSRVGGFATVVGQPSTSIPMSVHRVFEREEAPVAQRS